jgi:hypothetical protein
MKKLFFTVESGQWRISIAGGDRLEREPEYEE